MNNEGKFKKTLNDLIQSKEFEFDEANWQKASEMIDVQRQGKSRRVPVFLFSALILTIAIITGVLVSNGGSNKTSVLSEVKENTSAGTLISKDLAPVSLKVEESAPKQANTRSPHYPANGVTTPSPEKVSPEKSKTNSKNNPNAGTIVTQPNPSADSKIISGSGFIHQSKNDLETPASSEPQKPGEEKPSEPEQALTTLNQNPIGDSKSPVDADSGENKPVEKTTPQAPTHNNSSEGLSAADQKSNVLASNTTPDNKPAEQNTSSDEPLQTSVTTTESVVTSEPPKGVGVYPTLPVADSAMLANESTVTFDAKEKPLILSIEAGVSYLYGWKNPGKTDADGYNPFIGINYFQAILDKLSVSLGIQYTSVSHLSYSSHTTKVSSLGLGEDSKVTVFTPTKLHYLIAPLRFHYRFSPQNVAGLGCNMAYLLTVETDVETYNQNIRGTDGNSLYKDKGYTQGFRPFDIQLTGFYRRRLTSNLSFNAEIFYGLTDVKENSFFHSNVFERNSGLKISLVYNIQKNK